jgi:hypothetical protein
MDGAHLEYFEKYRDRLPFIQAAKDLLDEKAVKVPKIIEFGCSGGNNLRLIRELRWPISYCGLGRTMNFPFSSPDRSPKDSMNPAISPQYSESFYFEPPYKTMSLNGLVRRLLNVCRSVRLWA